jgi:ABC-type Mn2+/Zn2+ transport system ATPase subunit
VNSALITLRGADLGYKRVPIVKQIDLEVHAGQVLAIVGENGTGKTTLLRSLAGVLPLMKGERRVDAGRRLGYVPQQAQLDSIFPFTVAEVVGQGLARGPRLPAIKLDRRAEVVQALEKVGLADRAHRRFSDLSGGQKQRVLLARATALPVDLLLLDEPTAGVDQHAVDLIQDSLRELIEAGTGVVLVTHHPEDWKPLAQQWCEISDSRIHVRSELH